MRIALGLGALAMTTLAACNSSTSNNPTSSDTVDLPATGHVDGNQGSQDPNCTNLKASSLRGIADGLRKPYKSARLVEGESVGLLDSYPYNIKNVVAVRVKVGGQTHDVLFATTSPQADGGALFATGDALTYFTWGDFARAGSPVATEVTRATSTSEARVATSCL